ncbi:Uncharacterised protein [Mycobacteroides abscessus subsp. abscessus]|nr:Uncharacterised protein [Mycobacteroides abscessus subsp. abscessus]
MIFAFVKSLLVLKPACAPVNADASMPSSFSILVNTMLEMVSPQDKRRSFSRLLILLPLPPISDKRVSVAYGSPCRPIAETTATTL